MTYEQLTELRYEVSEQLGQFNYFIQLEVYSYRCYLRQMLLLISNGLHRTKAGFTQKKDDLGFVLNLIVLLRNMRRIWTSVDFPHIQFLGTVREQLHRYIHCEVGMNVLDEYYWFVRFMTNDYVESFAALCFVAWPNIFNHPDHRWRNMKTHLQSALGKRFQDNSTCPAQFDYQCFRAALFFMMYLLPSKIVTITDREILWHHLVHMPYIKLVVDRKEMYERINTKGYSHFFSTEEWQSGRRPFGKGMRGHKSQTLTDFMDSLFCCEHRKVNILIQSGKTNSGKSHSAQSWIAMLYQLNGVCIGSRIDGEFQRVSHLGKRHLRIVEEYKGNIIQDFHHLESNGKQLYSNNAVLPTRLALVIVNCDKSQYDLDKEAEIALQTVSCHYSAEDVLSRKNQVASRTFVLNWENQENALFQHYSSEFRKICNQMSILIVDAVMEQDNPREVFLRVDVGSSEILQRWDMSLTQDMRYTQLLQAFGDMAAWNSALASMFSAITRRELFREDDKSSRWDEHAMKVEQRLSRKMAIPRKSLEYVDEVVDDLEPRMAPDVPKTLEDIVVKHKVRARYMSPDYHECGMGKF